jgi:anti-anti-sigma factor
MACQLYGWGCNFSNTVTYSIVIEQKTFTYGEKLMAITHNGEIAKGVHLITVSEPLIGAQAAAFKQACQELSAQGIGQLVVDLEEVPLVDSRGLAALVTGYKLFGGNPPNFRLAGLQDQPKLVFDLTGFDHIFEIYDSVLESVLIDGSVPVRVPLAIPLFMPQWA